LDSLHCRQIKNKKRYLKARLQIAPLQFRCESGSYCKVSISEFSLKLIKQKEMKTLKLLIVILALLFADNNAKSQGQIGLGFGAGLDLSKDILSGTILKTDQDRAQVLSFQNYQSSGGLINGSTDISFINHKGNFLSMIPFTLSGTIINPGDIVIVIQMEGINVGQFIMAKVQAINGNTITVFD
jgi:hypothetical protein